MRYVWDLSERLFEYSVRILRLTESLPGTVVGKRIADQLFRSATSVGANYQEAQGAESKADFIHKLQIALKESREALYWLKLLANTSLAPEENVRSMIRESLELRAILSKAVATAKTNHENK